MQFNEWDEAIDNGFEPVVIRNFLTTETVERLFDDFETVLLPQMGVVTEYVTSNRHYDFLPIVKK